MENKSENKKKFVIYKTTNKLNGYIYIGVHATDNINDSYMGSGRDIRKIIKQEGKDNFIKEILFVYNTEKEALDKERELVNFDFINRYDTYNIAVGGKGLNGLGNVSVKDKDGNT